jgi:hypothetical protein
MAATNRIHYYHADACGFGGYLERPLEQNIAPQASLSLSPSGGYGSARVDNFRLEGLLSYESAFTQVSGRMSKKEGGGWQTTVTATVEGLNILDIVTADRLSAQISTEHPLEGDDPKVSFSGTSFENLRIAGYLIDVNLDLDICKTGNGNEYPERPCVSDERFLARVADHYRRMNEVKSLPEWVKERDRSIPNWIQERYDVEDLEDRSNSSIVTSIVKETSGKFPGRPFANAFEVPDVGKLFLGELVVDCKSFQLSMIRLELGCRAHGQTSGPTSKANGTTEPPGG